MTLAKASIFSIGHFIVNKSLGNGEATLSPPAAGGRVCRVIAYLHMHSIVVRRVVCHHFVARPVPPSSARAAATATHCVAARGELPRPRPPPRRPCKRRGFFTVYDVRHLSFVTPR